MRASEFRAVAAEKAAIFKNAFRSREGFKYFIETRPTALDRHGNLSEGQIWSNEDLDPTPPEKVLLEPFLCPVDALLTARRGRGGGGIMSPSTWACLLEIGFWAVPWSALD